MIWQNKQKFRPAAARARYDTYADRISKTAHINIASRLLAAMSPHKVVECLGGLGSLSDEDKAGLLILYPQ